MDGREISKMESALDCRGERELGKGKWSDLGMNEHWEVNMSLRSGGCLEFSASAWDA